MVGGSDSSITHIKRTIFYPIAIIHFTLLQTRALKIKYKRRDVIMKVTEVRISRIGPRIYNTKDQTDMKKGWSCIDLPMLSQNDKFNSFMNYSVIIEA